MTMFSFEMKSALQHDHWIFIDAMLEVFIEKEQVIQEIVSDIVTQKGILIWLCAVRSPEIVYEFLRFRGVVV